MTDDVQVIQPEDPAFWDPYWFAQMTKVAARRGPPVRAMLWPQQMILRDAVNYAYAHGKWVVAMKPRRGGFTNFGGILAAQHAGFRVGCHAAIMSYKRENVAVAMKAARLAWRHLPDDVRPEADTRLKRSMSFPDTDGQITGHSAKDDEPMRGEGVHFALFDELSSWAPHGADDVWVAARNAVSEDEGIAIAVSTPKYAGDPLQGVWQEADDPDSKWVKVFIPWTMIPEYYREPPIGWRPSDIVAEYAEKWGITLGHAYWMQTVGLPRCKNSIARFRAEYPITDYDAWSVRADGIFDNDRLTAVIRTRGWDARQPEPEEIIHLRPWIAGHRYVIICDPASSWALRDYFAITVIDIDAYEDCREFRGHIKAYECAQMLKQWSEDFNGARIYVERNGVGEAVLSHLEHWMVRNVFYGDDGKPGWWSSSKSRAEALGFLQTHVADGSYAPGTMRTIRQLMSYTEGWDGRDEERGHYDLLITRAIGAWAWVREGGHSVIRPVTENALVVAQRARAAMDRLLNGGYRPAAASTRWGDHR